MIRINLLPDHKLTTTDRGRKSLLVGLLAVVAIAALVYLLRYVPMKGDYDRFIEQNKTLKADIQKIKKELAGNKKNDKPSFDELKKIYADEEAREVKIAELDGIRINPNHVMKELSKILTRNSPPTYDPRDGGIRPSIDRKWDPKRVWITSIKEANGNFTIVGGSQTPTDSFQLANRMQLSIYFENVNMAENVPTVDGKTNTRYTRFKLVGKVVF